MTGDGDGRIKPAASLWIPGSRIIVREPGQSGLPAQSLILRLLAELRAMKPRRSDRPSNR